jgi:hypothetical protein
MGPKHDDREPQGEPAREALVDLNVKPQPGEPSGGSNLRRKRLSDMESEGNEAPPQQEPTREALVDLNAKPEPGSRPQDPRQRKRCRIKARKRRSHRT